MSLLRWLKLPLWALQLGTGAKSFVDNPVIGSKRLNRAGLHVARVRLAQRLAWWRRARLAHLVSEEDRAQFDTQGCVHVPDLLPADEFAELRNAILQRISPTREMVQGNTITRRIAIDPLMLKEIPALAALLSSPRWHGLMRYVASFDMEPLYYIQTILSHSHDGPDDPQTVLHEDAFHPSMKAWLFLTDVAIEDGPLTYVQGSHRPDAARLAWTKERSIIAREGTDRLSARGSLRLDRADLPQLGLPDPTAFAVPANTLVVADTYGFHGRGVSSRPSIRIEIWAYSRRSPFLPWTGCDVLSIPGIAARRVSMLWKMRDRLEKWVGQPWRDVGHKTPGDPAGGSSQSYSNLS